MTTAAELVHAYADGLVPMGPAAMTPVAMDVGAGGVSPWTFHLHPAAWVAMLAAAALYGRAWRRGRGGNRGQAVCFAAGLVALTATLTWPLDDLAAHWSVLAHIGQHLSLCLVCAPLILLGLPRPMVVGLIRRESVDRAVYAISAPVVAALVFNAVVLAAHVPVVVRADASSPALHASVNAAVLAAGILMWLPVLRVLPGTHHLSAPARVAYLLLQSIVPNVPAAFLTFASAPVYGSFTAPARTLGWSPVLDTQLAGALAKLLGAAVLWMAAAIIFFRSHRAERSGRDPDQLTWDDVERELRRAQRRPRPTTQRQPNGSRGGATADPTTWLLDRPYDWADWPPGGEAPPWEQPDARRRHDPPAS